MGTRIIPDEGEAAPGSSLREWVPQPGIPRGSRPAPPPRPRQILTPSPGEPPGDAPRDPVRSSRQSRGAARRRPSRPGQKLTPVPGSRPATPLATRSEAHAGPGEPPGDAPHDPVRSSRRSRGAARRRPSRPGQKLTPVPGSRPATPLTTRSEAHAGPGEPPGDAPRDPVRSSRRSRGAARRRPSRPGQKLTPVPKWSRTPSSRSWATSACRLMNAALRKTPAPAP